MTESFTSRLASTIVLVALIAGIRWILLRRLSSKADMLPTVRRQLVVKSRNLAFFLALGIVIVIWLEQLRTVAATIVVVAAAIVIATKEFLLNIVGYVYQAAFKFISIGDRIEIEEIRGDVIDMILRVPVPARKRGRMEKEITRRYLEKLELGK